MDGVKVAVIDYTIPRNNRELQLNEHTLKVEGYYTIPRNNRELQQTPPYAVCTFNYTIPRNNRELQLYLHLLFR